MSEIVYLSGELLPIKEANIFVDDRGFLLGDGLFETMRFDQSSAPHFSQHWARLQNGCDILGIQFSESPDNIQNHIKTLLQKNQLDKKSASVRLTLTRGRGPRGLAPPKTQTPTVMIRCFELLQKKHSISVMHSDVVINERSPLRQFKSLNYTENIIARQRAQQAGYDDALLYNTQGLIVGTTCANVFFIIDDQLVTPSLDSGALPGIMRQQILETSRQAGITVQETELRQEDCETASAAFITNSLIHTTPIHQLEAP